MEEITTLLKKNKLRVTPVRKELLALFLESTVALSNQDIESKMDKVDRITLYRTLKSFQEKGIIHKALDGTGTAKYASCSSGCDTHSHHDDHIHFHCTICDNTFCVEDSIIPKIEMPTRFKVKKLDVIVEGTCEHCDS